ncbi:MAG: TPM domain-containing protein [Bacteroidetes bacterium]|nr:TPM domain-containing protein [Bacteroidota bacterium]
MFFQKKALLDSSVQAAVVAAIRASEAKTSGELRVFVESHCQFMDAMDRAKQVFAKLQMAHTDERNAVLIYIALKDKQYALFGDEEIYRRTGGAAYWERAAKVLEEKLSINEIGEGLVACVTELGSALATHFPYQVGIDKNELPDEIVFGK